MRPGCTVITATRSGGAGAVEVICQLGCAKSRPVKCAADSGGTESLAEETLPASEVRE